jgi:carbon storage regulator
MLVLSRKLGQSFRVGPEVRITIVKIDRNSVRIGIEAPDDISVQRQEIADHNTIDLESRTPLDITAA